MTTPVWTVVRVDSGFWSEDWHVIDEHGERLAEFVGTEERANLIAAAPALCDALEDARAAICAAYCDEGEPHCEECLVATAALSLARGEQP